MQLASNQVFVSNSQFKPKYNFVNISGITAIILVVLIFFLPLPLLYYGILPEWLESVWEFFVPNGVGVILLLCIPVGILLDQLIYGRQRKMVLTIAPETITIAQWAGGEESICPKQSITLLRLEKILVPIMKLGRGSIPLPYIQEWIPSWSLCIKTDATEKLYAIKEKSLQKLTELLAANQYQVGYLENKWNRNYDQSGDIAHVSLIGFIAKWGILILGGTMLFLYVLFSILVKIA